MLKDVIGINLSIDDIQTIIKYSQPLAMQVMSPQKPKHTGRKLISRQHDQLSMSPKDSVYGNNTSLSRMQDSKSVLSNESLQT
jgi:hypothetical protein